MYSLSARRKEGIILYGTMRAGPVRPTGEGCFFMRLFKPKRAARFAALLPALLALALCAAGCGGAGSGSAVTSVRDLNAAGKRIGVSSGTPDDKVVAAVMPLAKIVYEKDAYAAYMAVAQGKLDAFAYDRLNMEVAIKNGLPGVRLLDEPLGEGNRVAIGISPVSKIPDLERQVNAFIDAIRADGTLDDAYARWVVEGDARMPDVPLPENAPFTLTVGTSGNVMPYSYYEGTRLTGRDVELAARLAAWLGARVEFKVYDYDAIVPAAQSGDVDCILANLYVTPERAEALAFSQPLWVSEVALLVRDEGAKGAGFWASLADSFEKTFVREGRWRLFVSGIGTTLLITALSILFGTALGFGAFLLCRRGGRIANAVTRLLVWLVEGMPAVVLLMILYYVVFGRVSVSGTAVSVLAFTLVFGAAVYAMVKTGTGAVDRGQAEAACSLGFTDRRAFFRVVLPQALPQILPPYRSQIKALIKATAVVGYVAVEDVTKMSDIVRSRTYDAFFPLITVAVIYFLLAAALTAAVDRLEIASDPRRRKPEVILKGVKGK